MREEDESNIRGGWTDTEDTPVALIKPFPQKVLDGINVICVECGEDLTGKVRIQNDKAGYVKCLKHGLGVTKRSR